MRRNELNEDFTDNTKPERKSISVKHKAAQYLGKDTVDNLSKSDLRKLQAKSNKMKKSEKKAERQRSTQISKQVSQANSLGASNKK